MKNNIEILKDFEQPTLEILSLFARFKTESILKNKVKTFKRAKAFKGIKKSKNISQKWKVTGAPPKRVLAIIFPKDDSLRVV